MKTANQPKAAVIQAAKMLEMTYSEAAAKMTDRAILKAAEAVKTARKHGAPNAALSAAVRSLGISYARAKILLMSDREILKRHQQQRAAQERAFNQDRAQKRAQRAQA